MIRPWMEWAAIGVIYAVAFGYVLLELWGWL